MLIRLVSMVRFKSKATPTIAPNIAAMQKLSYGVYIMLLVINSLEVGTYTCMHTNFADKSNCKKPGSKTSAPGLIMIKWFTFGIDQICNWI